ncbi:transmembrane 9 superfamily member 2 [Salpingoeca rosetta]|uniref:Transmembrane 9 superfamily member n=1 Tax=Salpingoeca rosetta (strain ATCC 50818 / BSB-021) TaxID=946362 RepID=F2UBW5_SALR5|nr:transmembrane 9 superfamily member 2 [Salpingoeca rosetta]EGD73981.1 transmembrane 9 superfamily member 2 [Salpingoeca rosetta]|eukprot:XP_004993544.1 transmembrane 9 superfamily member 2 [Salpingoeca rosetta]
MQRSKTCEPLCRRTYKNTNKKDISKYNKIVMAIRKDYMHHWILDNLPIVECTSNCKGGIRPEDQPYYRLGFPVGCAIGAAEKSLTACTLRNINNMYQNEMFINNHVDIIIRYHESPEFEGARVVGVEVQPRSIRHESPDALDCSPNRPPQPFKLKMPTKDATEEETLDLIFTYGVYFEESDIKWASRWDTYLRSAEGVSIQWFSIINSLVIVLFLSGMLGIILVRTLYKDIARYNQAEDREDAQEEFGWKLIHGDVFRTPTNPLMLSVLVGSGVQFTCMVVITLFFACLGFLSPATRGGLMTAMVTLWVCLGTPSGYVSARMYKMFGGEKWKTNTIMTATFVPGVVFGLFFILNLLLWAEHSSAALPFGTLVVLAVLWFFISVPLTFVGAYFGYKKATLEHPVRKNHIPRQIPPQPLYTRTLPAILMGGILPFGCIFIQLFFILTSIWGHKLYYVFGFLFLVFLILVVTTIESTILLCYFHLCSENYHWWWRAFLTGGASAIYLLIYEIIFYFRQMEVDGKANLFLYLGYSTIASFLFFLMTGTFGFVGCFYFVRRIYAVIKVD